MRVTSQECTVGSLSRLACGSLLTSANGRGYRLRLNAPAPVVERAKYDGAREKSQEYERSSSANFHTVDIWYTRRVRRV